MSNLSQIADGPDVGNIEGAGGEVGEELVKPGIMTPLLKQEANDCESPLLNLVNIMDFERITSIINCVFTGCMQGKSMNRADRGKKAELYAGIFWVGGTATVGPYVPITIVASGTASWLIAV